MASYVPFFVVILMMNKYLIMNGLTESFILNITWLLDPTLTYIDKLRLRQKSILSRISIYKVSKFNNKDTRTICGGSIFNSEHILHFILLLLLLNSNK